MTDYSEEGMQEAIREIRDGRDLLANLANAVDWQEPIHTQIRAEIVALDSVLVRLCAIEQEASQEIL